LTNSAVKIITIGLPGQISPVALFLQFNLDYFIVTRQLKFIYRDISVWTTLSWHLTFIRLPGLLQKPLQHRDWQLTILPNRYKQCVKNLDETNLFHLAGQCHLENLPWPETYRLFTRTSPLTKFTVTNNFSVICRDFLLSKILPTGTVQN